MVNRFKFLKNKPSGFFFRTFGILTITFAFLCFSPSICLASQEYVIKAGFLYHFTKFIQWPQKVNEAPKAGFSLCVAGENPFGSILIQLAQKRAVNGKRLSILENISVDNLADCQILFIGSSTIQEQETIVQEAQNFPVLVIGDAPGWARRGAGINFILIGNRVHFEINRQVIERKGFRISSELLNLGTLVEGDP